MPFSRSGLSGKWHAQRSFSGTLRENPRIFFPDSGGSMQTVLTALLSLFIVVLPMAADSEKETDRVHESGVVMKEILDIPDDIPKDLLDRAECVIVLPSVLKLAIGIGGSYGRGVMTCRTGQHFTGPWSAPSMIALEGGSFGLQLGGDATDFVVLVMNQRGAESIMSSKVKLCAEPAAPAGPDGRAARAGTARAN